MSASTTLAPTPPTTTPAYRAANAAALSVLVEQARAALAQVDAHPRPGLSPTAQARRVLVAMRGYPAPRVACRGTEPLDLLRSLRRRALTIVAPALASVLGEDERFDYAWAALRL